MEDGDFSSDAFDFVPLRSRAMANPSVLDTTPRRFITMVRMAALPSAVERPPR
jgi:hypothetical protein